jgi:hypothetical protein
MPFAAQQLTILIKIAERLASALAFGAAVDL